MSVKVQYASNTKVQAAAAAAASVAPQGPAQEEIAESQVLSMIPILDEAVPGIFSFDQDKIFVTSATPQQLDKFGRDIAASLGEPGLVATIVKALGDTLGKEVANLAGFKPVDTKGVEEDHFLLFGKIYMPEVHGCRAVFRMSQKETQSADFKISLSGFGGGKGRRLWCQLRQEDELHASPKDLVIPMKVKVLTWMRSDGKMFFTYSVLNYSKWIVARPARNPYFGSSGYDYLDSTARGALDRVHGGKGFGELKRDIEIGASHSYTLKALLNLPYGGAVEVEGEVEILSEIKVFYVLEPTHDYLLKEGKESPVEHYWAWKEAALGE